MTAQLFLTDCKVSCIFKEFCEVELIPGNKAPKGTFLSWEWFDGGGVGTPIHSWWVGWRVSGIRIHLCKEDLSQLCFHIIMVCFGRVWCIDTTACEWKTSLLKTKSKPNTTSFPIRIEFVVMSQDQSQWESTRRWTPKYNISPILYWRRLNCMIRGLISNKLWI